MQRGNETEILIRLCFSQPCHSFIFICMRQHRPKCIHYTKSCSHNSQAIVAWKLLQDPIDLLATSISVDF